VRLVQPIQDMIDKIWKIMDVIKTGVTKYVFVDTQIKMKKNVINLRKKIHLQVVIQMSLITQFIQILFNVPFYLMILITLHVKSLKDNGMILLLWMVILMIKYVLL